MPQTSRKIFVTDCEGPVTKNDNAAELAEAFIPQGSIFSKKLVFMMITWPKSFISRATKPEILLS